MMKKKLLLLMTGFLILAILVGVQIYQRSRQSDVLSTEDYIRQDNRITRAEIARMVSLFVYTRGELESLPRTITFEDTDESKWYDKYINGINGMGLVEDEGAKENLYHPMAYFTYGECSDMLIRITAYQELKETQPNKGQAERTREKLTATLIELQNNKKNNDCITSQEWFSLYEIIWKDFYQGALEETELYIIDTWENTEELDKWQTLTNEGIFYGDGLNFTPYLDKRYKSYIKENEILYLLEESEEESLISNVWIIEQEETLLEIFVNGCIRKLEMAGSIEEKLAGQVGDLYIEKGQITKVSIKPDRIRGRVLVANDNYLEIEGYGKKELSADFCLFRTYDGIAIERNNSIVVGYENAEFVIVGDEICAAIITEPIEVDNIRVLLKNTGFKNYYHEEITITSNGKFTVTYGEHSKSYDANKKVTIKGDSSWFADGRIFVETKKEGGALEILSIQRNGITPSYQGILELSKEEDGILIVNELPIEEYLYGVIPSEMPTGYGVEALKVQAVCARSFAYKQLMANGLRKYGAHVDDSSSYQVYNNIPSNEAAQKAANETRGQILQYNGEIITAYYFSTSCGHTASVNQVWSGTTIVNYLQGRLQVIEEDSKNGEKIGDLSVEENFKEFISEDICKTYDSDNPWYRWSVTIPKDKLKKVLEENLLSRYNVNPDLILTLNKEGNYESRKIETIGEIEEVRISERKIGGIITEIILRGTEDTIKIKSEFNIRTLLAPLYSTIKRKDGSKVENLGMLPSGFFLVSEKEKDGALTGFTFQGGGYGHGVGLSQNGAKAMIDLGYTYEDVLKHYYQGVQIGTIY